MLLTPHYGTLTGRWTQGVEFSLHSQRQLLCAHDVNFYIIAKYKTIIRVDEISNMHITHCISHLSVARKSMVAKPWQWKDHPGGSQVSEEQPCGVNSSSEH